MHGRVLTLALILVAAGCLESRSGNDHDEPPALVVTMDMALPQAALITDEDLAQRDLAPLRDALGSAQREGTATVAATSAELDATFTLINEKWRDTYGENSTSAAIEYQGHRYTVLVTSGT